MAKLFSAGKADDTVDYVKLLEVRGLVSDGAERNGGTLQVAQTEDVIVNEPRDSAGLIRVGQVAGLVSV